MNFKDEVVVITGGTGYFGHQVADSFLSTDIAEIRIFSRDKKKQEEMRLSLNDKRMKFYIGDVRDYASVNQAFRGAEYLFHAADLKQVPSCEFYPLEAIKTNILGAENVMATAVENKLKKVVVLRTDKAVYPINAMGQSKALMEKVMLAKARTLSTHETILCATRYGNVMPSRGSVIPLFASQFLEGKSITITDPLMARFFMSLPDSDEMVLHAFQHGNQRDIYVQKAPASTIEDLAQALQEILKKDAPIQVIGTRHGEKLYESLISREEMARVEGIGRYYRIPSDNGSLNYAIYIADGEKKNSTLEDYTFHNTERLSVPEIKTLLIKLDYI